MVIKDKLCKCGCGKSGKIWSKGYLKPCFFRLFPSKPLKNKSYIPKISEKQKLKNELKKEQTKILHTWFRVIFLERMDDNGYCYCFETGTPMHKSQYIDNSCIYSHYYPKSIYPQFALKDWNLEIILPDIHTIWELNHEKCPKMYAKFKEIKEKYGK